VSTLEKDYIIDCIQLNEIITTNRDFKAIFENSSIVKIFHSCHNDLIGLYTNFDIHTTNIFDTASAFMSVENKKNTRSLKDLAKHYLDV
jgi:ribonuclease D